MLVGLDLAGRKLYKNLMQGIPKLPLENQVSVVEQGNHHHRSGMGNPFSDGFGCIGKPNLIADGAY